MSIFIHLNGRQEMVARDLATITKDPGMGVSLQNFQVPNPDGGTALDVAADGRVFFRTPNPAMPEVGNFVVRDLVSRTDLVVLIRGEGPDFQYVPGSMLVTAGGVTTPLKYKGSQGLIQVIYDVTGCDAGKGAKGYYVLDATGAEIDAKTDVALLHELLHAYRKASSTENAADKEGQIVRNSPSENDYRVLRGYPKRAEDAARVHSGGARCVVAPPVPPKKDPPVVTRTGKGCFVATAAFGTPAHEGVVSLRAFRDEVLRPTRAGAAFFERFYSYYNTFSPPIADAMTADEDMRDAVRFALAEPIVLFLEMVRREPDAPLDGVPEPWLTFLREQREATERWLSQLELPECFCGMAPEEAADELAVLLRHVVRTPESRRRYLDRLEADGRLPLRGAEPALAEARARLERAGRPPDEVARIAGAGAPAGAFDAYLGVNEEPDIPGQNPSEWFYTATFSNDTQIATDPNFPTPIPVSLDFRVFYKRKGLNGVVYQEVLNVYPGKVAVIPMGVCAQMESYAWGAWGVIEVDGEMVYTRVVASSDFGLGDITPQKANEWAQQRGTADTDLCADSWRITS